MRSGINIHPGQVEENILLPSILVIPPNLQIIRLGPISNAPKINFITLDARSRTFLEFEVHPVALLAQDHNSGPLLGSLLTMDMGETNGTLVSRLQSELRRSFVHGSLDSLNEGP